MKHGRYSIGEISKLCCIPVSRLRYYDEQGVIKPCCIDSESGYRYYDNETLLLISVLKCYQTYGFTLREITKLLERLGLEHLEPMFDQQIEALDRQIRNLAMQRDSIIAWRDLIQEERTVAAQPECPVRHCWYETTLMEVSVPYLWDDISYRELVANIEMCNHIPVSAGLHGTVGPLYLYFPNGHRREFQNVRIYIRPHQDTDLTLINTAEICGCGALCTYHKGSFETGEEAYQRIYDYAAEHRIALRGDSFERSVIDWWSTEKEEEFLLEMILPTQETIPSSNMLHKSF